MTLTRYITANAYAYEIEVLQPLIEWNMGRDEEIKYAQRHGIPMSDQSKKFSIDENLFKLEPTVFEYFI